MTPTHIHDGHPQAKAELSWLKLLLHAPTNVPASDCCTEGLKEMPVSAPLALAAQAMRAERDHRS